ncbi:PEP-CTERM sorting domain-containing protein [Duganella sp. CY15W]|nr:PEP-CTERM sorting domain-containing protein [Duganella sp. CY15W]
MHTIPVVVTADFTGEQNGDVITNLSFQNFTYNGNVLHTGRAMAFPGSQNAAPVISFSGYSNDFYVHGAGGPEYPYSGSFFSYTFLDIPVQPPPQIGMEMFVPTIEPLYSYTPEDQEINYSWRVSAVPEPASYGMLLLGAALVGVTARRRKA